MLTHGIYVFLALTRRHVRIRIRRGKYAISETTESAYFVAIMRCLYAYTSYVLDSFIDVGYEVYHLIVFGHISIYVLYNADGRAPPNVKIVDEHENDATSQHGRETGPQFIILFAYMRGGSTFTGKLLSRHPGIFYWYEFLWDVYNSMLSSGMMSTVPAAVAFDKDFKYLRSVQSFFMAQMSVLILKCITGGERLLINQL